MQQLTVNVFKFSELETEIQQKVISNFLSKGTFNHIESDYYDAIETIRSFSDFTGIQTSRNNWFEVNFNSFNDNILELKGLRLRKYILNNFTFLYNRKYIGTINKKELRHKYVIPSRSKKSSYCYSNINFTNDCTLTGVYYDNDFLKPIYDFIENYSHDSKNNNYVTFLELITDCFESLKLTLEKQEDYYNSSEYITERLNENEYTFLSNGEIFNY